MNRLTTKNFDLAIYAQGDPEADKLALAQPGLLETKDYAHMRSHVDYLASLGYYAVSFDPPGTWESGDEQELYTTTNYIRAMVEVIEMEGRPTFLLGHSLAGRVIIEAAARSKNVEGIAAIMSASTFLRPSNVDERETMWRQKGSKIFYKESPDDPDQLVKFELPYAFSKDAQAYDSLRIVGGLAIPKLFVAGRYDAVVEQGAVMKLHNAAVPPKELLYVESGHDYRRYPAAVDKVNFAIGQVASKYSLQPQAVYS